MRNLDQNKHAHWTIEQIVAEFEGLELRRGVAADSVLQLRNDNMSGNRSSEPAIQARETLWPVLEAVESFMKAVSRPGMSWLIESDEMDRYSLYLEDQTTKAEMTFYEMADYDYDGTVQIGSMNDQRARNDWVGTVVRVEGNFIEPMSSAA